MPTKLTDSELKNALEEREGWAIEDGMLNRHFAFTSYLDGLHFAMQVGQIAESMDHHPDLWIGYQKVRVATSTHSAGGLTRLDFDLAAKIDLL